MERTKSLGTLDNMDIPNRMQKPENMPVNTSSMEFSPAEYISVINTVSASLNAEVKSSNNNFNLVYL